MQSNNSFFCSEEQYYETMIQKLVIFEKENSTFMQQVKVQFYYNPLTRQINLTRSLNQFFSRQNTLIQNCQIFYYDQNLKYFIYAGTFPFEKDLYLKYEELQQEYIRIKCKQLYYDEQQSQVYLIGLDQSKPPQNNPKKRAKQRTIKQVLQKVAEWRGLAENKKCNLQTAAKLMGMSKKTLDDYYMQIKLAQTHGFDFQFYQNLGIGILRKFVKEKHEKKKPYLKILSKYMNNQNPIGQEKKQHTNSVNSNIDEYFVNYSRSDDQQEQEE